MAIYVAQGDYKIVTNDDEIGSFGADPCTIMILYDDNSRFVSHVDAVSIFYMESIKTSINTYLEGKDKSKIKILFTDSGNPNNKILRNKLKKLLKQVRLENKIILIDGTQVIINSKNQIFTEFDPQTRFGNISDIRSELLSFGEGEMITGVRNLLKKLQERDKSLKLSENKDLDMYGRPPPPESGNYFYNYDLEKWVESDMITRDMETIKKDLAFYNCGSEKCAKFGDNNRSQSSVRRRRGKKNHKTTPKIIKKFIFKNPRRSKKRRKNRMEQNIKY